MTDRHILFAMPIYDMVEPKTMLEVARLVRREDTTFMPVMGSPIDVVRNGIVKMFLENPDYTHLFMLDSDVVPGEGVLDYMLACDWPMAAGVVPICCQNAIVTNIVIKVVDGKEARFMTGWSKEQEPFIVEAAGTGCVLYRREVFETIPWPWYRWVEEAEGRVGEDIFFSRKAAGYGYTYKVHPQAVCDHYKKFPMLEIVRAFEGRKPLADDTGKVETGSTL